MKNPTVPINVSPYIKDRKKASCRLRFKFSAQPTFELLRKLRAVNLVFTSLVLNIYILVPTRDFDYPITLFSLTMPYAYGNN